MTKPEAETLLQLIISDDNTAVQLGYDLFIQYLDYFRHNQNKTIPPEIEENRILKLLGYRLEYKPTITNPCVEITL